MLGSMLKTTGTKQPSREHLFAPRAPEPPPQLPRYESSSFSSAQPEETDDHAYAQPAPTSHAYAQPAPDYPAYAQPAPEIAVSSGGYHS